jgi:glucose-1-phosphate thymidylyltransferase
LEITDLNVLYMSKRRLAIEQLGRGFAWFDAGTHDSLLEAAEFVRVLQGRQGQLVCAPEEVAFRTNWINAAELSDLADKLNKTPYASRLRENL